MSVRKAIARNTAFNAAGRLWEFVASILLLAYIMRRLGPAEYGSWALVGPFLGYVALLDIGLSSGFAKHVAERAAKKDDAGLSAVVSSGFLYYLLTGVVIVAVGFASVQTLLSALAEIGFINTEVSADLLFLCSGGLVLLAVSNGIAAFTAVQTGLQRMDITNGFSFVASLVKIGATVALLESGAGVRGLLYAEGLSTAVFGFCSVAAAFYLCPGLRVSLRHFSRPVFQELFHFGWKSQVARFSNLVMFQTDKLLVGAYYAFAGMADPRAQIGVYDVGVSMAGKLRNGPTVLTSALLPAASHLDALDKHDRLQELYLRSTKYLAVVAVPSLLFGAYNCQLIMRAWMGPEFERAGWILALMAVGYLANVLPGAGVSIVLGKGRADLVMGAGLVSMGSNLVLTIALMLTIGFWGIPIATVLSMVISWTWFSIRVRPILGAGMGTILYQSLLWPALASIPGAAAAWACAGLAPSSIAGQLVALAASAVLFAVGYGAVLSITPFFDTRDVSLLQSATPADRIPGLTPWLAFAGATGSIADRFRAFAHSRGRGYPDWAMRYLPVVQRMERGIENREPFLEIGANENGYARFARHSVIAVDRDFTHLQAARSHQSVLPVVADIAALPFADATFAGIVSMDTFEHIPSHVRNNALAEIDRCLVLRGKAAIGFPSGPDAQAAEADIRAAYRAYTGGTIRWLEEHVEQGLPDGAALRDAAATVVGDRRRVSAVGNAHVHTWRWMWRVMMCGWPGRGNAVAQALLLVLTPLLIRRQAAPHYRTILWLEPHDG